MDNGTADGPEGILAAEAPRADRLFVGAGRFDVFAFPVVFKGELDRALQLLPQLTSRRPLVQFSRALPAA